MLTDTIIRYMQSNRRLVVPQLGAFVAKEPGGPVCFTELLRRDDGVLRALLRDEGMSELEAAGAMDRFVFEVRHAVQEGSDYPLAGLGSFCAGPGGTIRFLARTDCPAVPETDGPAVSERPAAAAPVATECDAKKSASGPEASRSGSGADGVPEQTTEAQPAMGPSRPEEHRSDRAERIAGRFGSDPAVKGLRYGRPQRTTDAYTYVGSAPRRRGMGGRWVVALACAAAVLALAVIVYGYLRDRQAARETLPAVEELFPSAVPTAPGETLLE